LRHGGRQISTSIPHAELMLIIATV